MKRNIYRFINLLLVLGFVATGCGQVPQQQLDAILDKVESEADNEREESDTEAEDTVNESEDADNSETLEEAGQEDDTAQKDESSQDESNQDSSYSDYKPEEEEDKDSVVVGEEGLDNLSQVTINSTTSSVLVHVNKNTYFDDYHANTAYRIKTLAEIKPLLEERHAISASFRVIYRYGDELGRLSEEELTGYIEKNLAPGWASGYCFESYKLSCDDFTCVVSITFYNARHSSQGSSWEYEKEPTCIESGLMVLRCSKCGKVTGSHEVEATGVHTYRWNYENESTRTPTCIHCSHVGKTEICLGGVWGYYDTEKALAFVEKINQQRANTRKGVVDDWGNCVGVITPPPLTIDTSLNQKAETRVIQLILSDFKNTVDDEAFYTSVYYENTKQVKGYAGGVDWCDEKYTRIGVSCFCVDRDNSGLNFLDQYAFEFGE